MFRNLASPVAIVLAFGLATTASAQSTAVDSAYGVYPYGSQPYGGFGLEYSQPLAGGGVIMDQYGLLHVVPSVAYTESAPVVAPARPATSARPARSSAHRAGAQPRYQLPTGSLGAGAGNGGILYTPGMRYQSYGNGYGHGPYGVTDYGYMWKGWGAGY